MILSIKTCKERGRRGRLPVLGVKGKGENLEEKSTFYPRGRHHFI